jgi:hypothetical protein
MADPITFYFTGTVDFDSILYAPNDDLGQAGVEGYFTFESGDTDGCLGVTYGCYNELTNFHLLMLYQGQGIYFIWMGNFPLIRVINDESCCSEYPYDGYDVSLHPPFAPGTHYGNFYPLSFGMGLLDATSTAFSSDALPLTPPDLSSFANKRWGLVFLEVLPPTGEVLFSPPSVFPLGGEITSLTLSFTPVLEPTTLLLLGSGLAGLAGFSRNRFRGKAPRR